MLLLNAHNSIPHQAMIYRGTIHSVHVCVAELYQPAVRENAVGIVLSHVHPSGDPQPSPEDRRVTSMAYEAMYSAGGKCACAVWGRMQISGLGLQFGLAGIGFDREGAM